MRPLLLVFVLIGAAAAPANAQTYENPFHDITTRHDVEAVEYPEKITGILNEQYELMPWQPTYIQQKASGDTVFLDVYRIKVDSNDTHYLDATKKFWNCVNGLLIPVYSNAEIKRIPANMVAKQKLVCRVAYTWDSRKEANWVMHMTVNDDGR